MNKDFLEALIKAHGEFPDIIKDKKNPFFKSTYADLANVLNAVMPTLLKNNLVLIQTFETEGQNNFLKTHLFHTSGESICSRQLLIPVKSDPQGIASASTYARRYEILALLSLATEDDDGNAATQTETHTEKDTERRTENKPPKDPNEKISGAQSGYIITLLGKLNDPAEKDKILKQYNVKLFTELTKIQAGVVIEHLAELVAQKSKEKQAGKK